MFFPLIFSQPELSALLDAFERSSCNPETASALMRSLVSILCASPEKTIASFKTLGAPSRVLKVVCVQAEELRKWGKLNFADENCSMEEVLEQDQQKCNSDETMNSLSNCMKLCMELYAMFSSTAEDARNLILKDFACINYLFDLFWVEGLRNAVLREILELMKVLLCFIFFVSLCYDVMEV